MLQRLSVRDFLLIERLELDFHSGFTVITGETGAGKSLLLESLLLALGEKGSGDLVRPGAASAAFIAVFDALPELTTLFKEHDLPDDDTIIVKRVIDSQGRSKGFINDTPVSLALLRAAAAVLLEIQGQHCAHALFTAAGQRQVIDALVPQPLRAAVRAAAADVRDCRRALEDLEKALESARLREDFLRSSAAELQALGVASGELGTLLEEKQQRSQRQKTQGIVEDALKDLERYQDLAALSMRLSKKLGAVSDGVTSYLDSASDALAHAEKALLDLCGDTRDTARLQAIEDRIYALRDAERKFRTPAEALPDLAAQYLAEVTRLDDTTAALKLANEALHAAETAYTAKAAALSAARSKAAQTLTRDTAQELKALKLAKARFRISVSPLANTVSDEGSDSIVFMLQANPDLPEAPLAEAASGGEMVRVLLALRLASNSSSTMPLLIFDEADQGVGGAVAAAIGQRLKKLAQHTQVIAITHAPQVAAAGDLHLLAQKNHKGKQTLFTANYLEEAKRLEEIARMLAGETTTTAARQAARELLGYSAHAA